MDIKEFEKLPVLGILRNVFLSELPSLVSTIIDSGLKTIEIAMNTDDASSLIKEAVILAGGRLTVGAGTVLNIEKLETVLGAGATFIVTPVLIKEVADYCIKNKIPVFPGALTPSEIYKAWERGAAMVKVFPAKVFGPDYFRELRGPFNDIKLMAVGGVTPENAAEYFRNGANAIAFGANVFKREWLDKKDFLSIKNSIKRYLENNIPHI